jgi:hypothetical protein
MLLGGLVESPDVLDTVQTIGIAFVQEEIVKAYGLSRR